MKKKYYSKVLKTNVLDVVPVDIGSRAITENGILYLPEIVRGPYAGFSYKDTKASGVEIAYIPEQNLGNYDNTVNWAIEKRIPFTGLFQGYTRDELLREVENKEDVLIQMLDELCYEAPSTWYENYLREQEEEN